MSNPKRFITVRAADVIQREGRAWHGTNARFVMLDHDKSRLGTHFGTAKAAKDREKLVGGPDWNVRSYDLAITKPLRLADAGMWDIEEEVLTALESAGIPVTTRAGEPVYFDESIPNEDTESPYPHIVRPPGVHSLFDAFRHSVERAGYDSVVYTNTHEDPGADSWIVWRNELINDA